MSQNHANQPSSRQCDSQFGQRDKMPQTPWRLPFGAENSSQASAGNSANMVNNRNAAAPPRILWFDYAKGICIILVVMMHSTLGVGKAFGGEGFMHVIVAYAKPFRMPDFFMLSGLFLSLAIGRSWLHYLDKKLVHFAYFYFLWFFIQALIKTSATVGLSASAIGHQFLDALINPYPTLWFIYVLPLFFIVTKALRFVPGWLMLAGAAVLQTISIHTGWSAIDHFAVHYYVFFLGGYLLAPYVFKLADWAGNNLQLAAAGVAGWAVLNGILAFTPSPIAGWDTVAALPLISIALGAMGATAIVAIAAMLQKFDVAHFIRYCGRNSIVLYVSFAIPMALSRVILLKTGVITDIGVVSLMVWLTALFSPLILHFIVKRTPLRFLYERPTWLGLPYQRPEAAKAQARAEGRIARVVGASA